MSWVVSLVSFSSSTSEQNWLLEAFVGTWPPLFNVPADCGEFILLSSSSSLISRTGISGVGKEASPDVMDSKSHYRKPLLIAWTHQNVSLRQVLHVISLCQPVNQPTTPSNPNQCLPINPNAHVSPTSAPLVYPTTATVNRDPSTVDPPKASPLDSPTDPPAGAAHATIATWKMTSEAPTPCRYSAKWTIWPPDPNSASTINENHSGPKGRVLTVSWQRVTAVFRNEEEDRRPTRPKTNTIRQRLTIRCPIEPIGISIFSNSFSFLDATVAWMLRWWGWEWWRHVAPWSNHGGGGGSAIDRSCGVCWRCDVQKIICTAF